MAGIDHEDAFAPCRVFLVDYDDAGWDARTVEEIRGEADDALDDAALNEIPPDGDVSYVSSSNIGDIDTYKIPNTGYTPPIQVLGVQSVIYCRKDLAGTRIIAPVIRQGGVDAVMADFSLPLTTYTYAKQVYDLGGDTSLNPATGLAWTQADLTAAEFGQKVTG